MNNTQKETDTSASQKSIDTNLSTPPNQHSPLRPPDTEQRARTPINLSTLDTARTTILRDLHSIPTVDLQYFLQFALPRPKSELPQAGPHFEHTVRQAFPVEPAKMGSTVEGEAFRSLYSIFDHVTSAVLNLAEHKSNKQLPKFLTRPNSSPHSVAHSSSRPDGCLIKPGGDYSWNDIAVSFEFKKQEEPQDVLDVSGADSAVVPTNHHKNCGKVIWSMHQIMRSDPCRRFTFGITIENLSTRLWLMARGVVLVSKPFDILKESTTLFKVMASFLLADLKSLGWDPTVNLVGDNSYEIVMKNGIYKNATVIYALGPELARGRGTRVFTATDPNGKSCVIKDVWQDSDREYEDEILRRISPTIQPDGPFLHPTSFGPVRWENGSEDDVLQCVLHGQKLQEPIEFYRVDERVAPAKSRSRHQGSLHGITQVGVKEEKRYPFKPQYKIHYRSLVQDRGQTVDKLETFVALFSTLLGALSGLAIMFHAGYVHRDVSVGNILTVGGKGKLTDFEYAKHVDSTLHHDVRTGTEEFMALEVSQQKYIFFQKAILERDDDDVDENGNKPSKELEVAPPFRHNALHDLESLWWVAVWFLFTAHFRDSPGQQDAREELFGSRILYFSNPSLFYGLASKLDDRVRDIHKRLYFLLLKIRRWYTKMEESSESITAFKCTQVQIGLVRECFEGLVGLSQDLPEVVLDQSICTKRQIEEVEKSGTERSEIGNGDGQRAKKSRNN